MSEAHKRPYRHPKYKTSYHVKNRPEYEKSLWDRGDITVWLSQDAIDTWTPLKTGRLGGQQVYSDLAIETALTLRGDGVYDRESVNEDLEHHSPGVSVIIPTRKDAELSRMAATSPTRRDVHIAEIQSKGRFRWKRESGYDRQSHAENAFFRYKTTFGGRLRARDARAQEGEAALGYALLNRKVREMDRPQSHPIG